VFLCSYLWANQKKKIMKIFKIAFLSMFLALFSCKNTTDETKGLLSENLDPSSTKMNYESVGIFPINHATMVLTYNANVIFVDPVGGADLFKDQAQPNFVLVTDIHGDHMDKETLMALDLSNAYLIVPKAVADLLPELKTKETIILSNGESKAFDDLDVSAIPMYNLREEALKFHSKGRGNGYVLTLGSERIYISGDTEDIPEMRSLKDIDIAFVCMNLPYTMTVESAASAVLDFKPKKVYPYHYRGTEGFSDVSKFKSIINKENSDIEVMQLNWYK
jgi:L-ascorbate metabolism protein UlaG (beta-lactamase superfamily)